MSSRYVPREQALPNSSRRLARASQRNSNSYSSRHVYETTTSSSHRRIHSNNRTREEEQEDTTTITGYSSNRDKQQSREYERSKRKEAQLKIKEIQDLIQDVKRSSDRTRDRGRSSRHNDDARKRREGGSNNTNSGALIGEQEEGHNTTTGSRNHRDYHDRKYDRSRHEHNYDGHNNHDNEEYNNNNKNNNDDERNAEYPLPPKDNTTSSKMREDTTNNNMQLLSIDNKPSFDSTEIDGASELTSNVDYMHHNPTDWAAEADDDRDFVEEELFFDNNSNNESEQQDDEEEEDDDDALEYDFKEDIDETTYYDEDGNIIVSSHNNDYGFSNEDSEDDESEDSQSNYVRRSTHYDDVNSGEYGVELEDEPSVMSGMVSNASEYTRSNSPEPNPNSRGMIHHHHHQTAAGVAATSSALVTRQISADPPTSSTDGKLRLEDYGTQCMEPNEEIGSVYQRNLELDAPPSPKGPELRRRDSDATEQQQRRIQHSKSSTPYNNYILDDVGREEYQNEMKMISPIAEDVRRMKVQQDPPESNRGLDVPAPRAPRVRSSKSSKKNQQRHKEEKKKKPQPQLKSILKKKSSPPIVSYFGKPIVNAAEDDVSCGSDPSVTESKHGKGVKIAHADSDDVKNASGGMRSGKYATINDSDDKPASRRSSRDSDDKSANKRTSSRDDSDDDSNSNENCDIQEQSDEESDAGGTIQTIYDSKDDRFDRSKTYYLRTSDLGLTQDTIFAEQFLDNPKSKAEPHYHHPSPHPPPGIQFSIDENYLAINDGKGSHSPVAPQAVDALVAVGYRTCCDPVMWTPTSKTRKYMTERGLRFSDIPLPGPLEEGEGGAEDSSCMVFTGKFTHKYYGHDIIAIRSQGIVNMSAEELVDLLMDSNRIQEYNSSSTGRSDEIILSDGTDLDSCPFSGRRKKKLTGVVLDNTRIVDGVAFTDSSQSDDQSSETKTEDFDDDGNKSISSMTSSNRHKKKSSFVGVTKVVRSVNKVPFVKKKMEFVTLVHCRALTDDQGGNGYIIVSRNVYPAEDAEKSGKGMMRSEVLLNVHLIRKFKPQKKGISSRKSKSDGKSVITSASGKSASARELADRCLMINVSHLKSPIIPSVMAKKMGSTAAASFINDIRALTVNWN